MQKLNLFGVVYPASDCINAADVSKFLAGLQDNEEFTVYLNSPGGSVFEGLAIYNLLSEYQSRMTIKIIGEASSIASVIACAAAKNKTLIAETALMLIHNPWTFAIVDEDYLAKLQKNLDAIKNSILTVYENKTGKSRDELNALMKEGDYIIAQDAVGLGLADSVYSPSDEEAKTLQQSNQITKALLRKYVIMNLQFEKSTTENQNKDNNLFFNNQGDDSMTFKSIEEAAIEYGKLQNQVSSLNTNLTELQKANDGLKTSNAEKDSAIQSLQRSVSDFENKVTALETSKSEMQNTIYLQEAQIFCEDMFNAGKLTRAEINGSADVSKGQTPAKVLKLVALRTKAPELYDMEKAEIEAKSPESFNSLRSDFDYKPSEGANDNLVNFIEQDFNKRRRV